MVTTSVRPDTAPALDRGRRHVAFGYLNSFAGRQALARVGQDYDLVRQLPFPSLGGDGPCCRPLVFWDSHERRVYLRPCGSAKSKVCKSCATARKRRVRRIVHLGVLDRLASGGFMGMATFTGPGLPGHNRWVIGGRAHQTCGCEASVPGGVMGAWNRRAARRWNHLRTLIRRDYPGTEFYRAVEPQIRGVLHLHVIIWSPRPIDPVVLQALALRAGFGCNTQLDVCHGPEDGQRFANYATKYVTKSLDDRHVVPWEDLDLDSGELRSAVATYRAWSQSRGFGVRMKVHLEAIARDRRRHALRLQALEQPAPGPDPAGLELVDVPDPPGT